MKRSIILASLLALPALTSCTTMHDAAVSTFRVVDAPNQYVRRKLGVNEEQQQQQTTTTTTTETYSDSSHPPSQPYPVQQQQQPIPPPPVQTQRQVAATKQQQQPPPPPQPRATATPPVITRESAPPTTTSTQRTAASSQTTTDLPYAKPVPGKPGYVFSPFDKNGGYVDVTGYSPGQKVKDPYSGKIFLVP